MNSDATADSAADLNTDDLPAHVAIIMDGNGRWARKRLANRVRGHEQGVETVRKIVRAARRLNIAYLTLYAFSTENWERPKKEVMALMALLKRFLISEKAEMMQNNIRLNTIGETQRLPDEVRHRLLEAIYETSDNTGMTLTLALSYGARTEIVKMVRSLAQAASEGKIDPAQIDEREVAQHLYTASMPDPDLLIRTSGEMRLSNFLLWQSAYTELYITDALWPDFTPEKFKKALKAYQMRDRRFGKVP